MNMSTAQWSEGERESYRKLFETVLGCLDTDAYTFFQEWIDEARSRETRHEIREQMVIARELGYLQDEKKAQDLWTRLERHGLDIQRRSQVEAEKDLAQASEESGKGMDR
jgi:hypothetical protein